MLSEAGVLYARSPLSDWRHYPLAKPDDRLSTEYLAAARQRIKRRSGAWMSLVIGPFILLLAALKIMEPHDYPAGDVRNEPLFWILTGLLAVGLVAVLVIGSIRLLTRGQ